MSIFRPQFLTSWTEQLGKIRLKDFNESMEKFKTRLRAEYYTAKEKLKDIPSTNYALGLYHFQHRNMFDAIFRFRLVTWLRPNHASAYLYLAKSYVLTHKFELAKKAAETALSLDNTLEDAQFILDKLVRPTDVTSIPPALILEHLVVEETLRGSKNTSGVEKNRARIITKKILSYISDSNPHLNVLELAPTGTHYGAAFHIRKVTSAIDALVPTDKQVSTLSAAEANRTPIYRHVRQGIMPQALDRPLPSPPYDVIIGDHALDYCGNISSAFQTLHGSLSSGGLFMCILPIHSEDIPKQFHIETDRFTYAEPYVINSLTQAAYTVLESVPLDILLGTDSTPLPSANSTDTPDKPATISSPPSEKPSVSFRREHFFLCKKQINP